MQQRTCDIDGCQKPPRSPGSAWCKMHYHRWYRHGSTDVNADASPLTVSHGRRYRMVSDKGHPLADKAGRVYEHRKVLYDHIGPGPHSCHWCQADVEWLPKGADGELQVDHLNNMGDDNQIENLAPSCRGCNSTRGSQRRAAALKAAGWWSSRDTISRLTSGGRAAPIEV